MLCFGPGKLRTNVQTIVLSIQMGLFIWKVPIDPVNFFNLSIIVEWFTMYNLVVLYLWPSAYLSLGRDNAFKYMGYLWNTFLWHNNLLYFIQNMMVGKLSLITALVVQVLLIYQLPYAYDTGSEHTSSGFSNLNSINVLYLKQISHRDDSFCAGSYFSDNRYRLTVKVHIKVASYRYQYSCQTFYINFIHTLLKSRSR